MTSTLLSSNNTRPRYITKQQSKMIDDLKRANGDFTSAIAPHAPLTARVPVVEEARNRRASEAWCGQTTGIIELSNAQRSRARNLKETSAKEAETARVNTNNMINDVNEKLLKKVTEATQLLTKLRQGTDALQAENNRLTESRRNANALLNHLLRPLRKCEKRQTVRSQRPARENIEDTVEKSLTKEKQELTNAIQVLTEIVQKCDRQLEAMHKAQQQLEDDMNDKEAAIAVDKECLGLSTQPVSPPKISRANDPSVRPPPGIHGAAEGPNGITKSTRLPVQWKESSNVLLSRSKELINISLDLRTSISVVVKKVNETQQMTCANVEECLRKKVQVTTQLHQKLSKQRLTLNSDIENLRDQREKVLLELGDLNGPVDVVSRRLELRRTRPSREQVRDAVEEALESEYSTLVASINKLKKKLAGIDAEIEGLLRAQQEVTLDLEDKSRALELDQAALEANSAMSRASSSASSVVSLPPVTSPGSRRYHQ
eukprot:PhM_4_TR10411/c0_g1_i2/m.73086/K18628/TEKT1; tektin-1